jgi:hypothetical protein
MQKYYTLIIFIGLFSCKPKTHSVPSSVLPANTMSTLLSEMHIADAVTAMQQSGEPDSLNQYLADYKQAILNQYKVSSDQFLASITFYEQHPEMLDSIYAEVITKLSEKETKYRGR